MVAPRPTSPGAIWPCHQTSRTPARDARNAANPNASDAVQRDDVAERRHAHVLVPDPLERDAERGPHDVADQAVDDEGGTERDVVEAVAVGDDVADEARRVAVDAADPREAGDHGHLADEVEGDHRERQRDHQEVDPEAARGDRAEDHPEQRRAQKRKDERERRVPAERQALGLAAAPADGDHVPDHEAGRAHQRGLRERDHPAVGGEEDEAGGGDPDDEDLRQDRVDPVVVEDQRAERDDDQRADRDHALRRLLGLERHASLPKSPCGRTASTSASRANVTTIEYCVQQLFPVVGR